MKTPITIIRRMFDSEFRLLVTRLGYDPEKDVSWPNIQFDPDTSRIYFAVSHLYSPTQTASCGIDGFERLSGIYQITIFDLLDKGVANTEKLANVIIDHFRGGTILHSCGVEVRIQNTYLGNSVPEDLRFSYPISVNWYCYAQKSVSRDKDPILGGF